MYRKLYLIALYLMLVALLTATGSAVRADPLCNMDEAQRLFGQRPRPDSAIEAIFAACLKAGVYDKRIFMLEGVIARDQGRLDDSADLLEKAHRLDLDDPSPALELGVTQEWRHQLPEARLLYAEILEANPRSRAAMLGLARVALAQTNLEEARRIYGEVLVKNPEDIEGKTGLAWSAFADKRFDDARAGFEGVLAAQPQNAAAQQGLDMLKTASRYQLDLTATSVSTRAGHAWGAGSLLVVDVDALNQLEVGQYHYTSQISAPGIATEAMLPRNDVRLGYNRRVPDGYHFSLAYNYRDHGRLPTEHWISASIGDYLARGIQWFAGYRHAFGADQWQGGLASAGLIVPITDGWEAVATVFYAHYRTPGSTNLYSDKRTGIAYAADLNRQGPGGSFFNIGIGYSPDVENFDQHARWILPVNRQVALLFSVQHSSVTRGIQSTAGMRLHW